ncbi:MAG: hypothetical protein O8C64_02605 [Candidatus Methanoperedens sp.]|nr:hypothetical protein [Candidatus Methanoperedens sp.]
MITDGPFYTTLKSRNEASYSPELIQCIEDTVHKLLDNDTSINKPGMLLGKIQSGKTKTFLGAIGLAFDNGYDITIILTKGTNALAKQTYQRLEQEFGVFREEDRIQIFDIMNLPDNLTLYELNQKLIIISKKETNNLRRLHDALFLTYTTLSEKNILIIDDEADFASIGFKSSREEGIEMRRIASQIDEIRRNLECSDFLQVTATPYSLYLQPDITETNQIYEPQRPAFTELVPIHPQYIGGDYYFEEGNNIGSVASYLFNEVSPDEMDVLKREDRRGFRIEESLTSHRIGSLRNAIINFIVGGCIRRLQDRESHQAVKKFSFIIHTETAKGSHQWQENIVRSVYHQLLESISANRILFDQLIDASYQNLSTSINILHHYLPPLADVNGEVMSALLAGELMITVVNSERNVNELLDDQGQLKLRTPLNIFIGGQILDRGITIKNLIGFYYGRRPNQFQQDTVLQHSRMYGFRPIEDLTVTRFYTTLGIYQAMRNIHIFDSALRDAFLRGVHNNGIVFIRRDNQNRIVPCSPNKILLSTTTTLTPYKRLLPIGFQTGYRTNIHDLVERIETIINDFETTENEPFLLDIEAAKNIIDIIYETLIFEEPSNWDVDAFKSCMEYLSSNSNNPDRKNKIWCLVRRGREISRKKADDTFSTQPDNPETDQTVARNIAVDIPMLILLKQNGDEDKGWRGTPFWWPVLWTHRNTQTVIFASDINEEV